MKLKNFADIPQDASGDMFGQIYEYFLGEFAKSEGQKGDIHVYGQEKTLETVKLAKMNLAVNGLRGEVRQANSYYEDPYDSFGKFDYVMANPPFNVDDVSFDSVGKETVPNANYLWISLFASSLKEQDYSLNPGRTEASDCRICPTASTDRKWAA